MRYYASGLPMQSCEGGSAQNRKYNGKEFIEAYGLDEYDSQARHYYPAIARTTTMDPLAEKYYSISPYAWCANNPINVVDLNGMDWFFYADSTETDASWHWHDGDSYNTGIYDDNGEEIVLSGVSAVVSFEGYYDESLGIDGKLMNSDGIIFEGAKMAQIIVYGPNGESDVAHYSGYTMSSDPSLFGVLANGEYDVNRSDIIYDTIPENYTLVVSKPNYIPYIYTSATCFLQNKIISDNQNYNNCSTFKIGSNITPIQPYGNVIIDNGGSITINASDEVIIYNDFEVKLGGTLVIQ